MQKAHVETDHHTSPLSSSFTVCSLHEAFGGILHTWALGLGRGHIWIWFLLVRLLLLIC